MIAAGAVLQQAMFARIDAHQNLAGKFRTHANAIKGWPQFSFDSLESRPLASSIELIRHDVSFTIWAGADAVADATDLSDGLMDAFNTPLELTGYHLVSFHTRQAEAALQGTERLWRLIVRFEAVTQKATHI